MKTFKEFITESTDHADRIRKHFDDKIPKQTMNQSYLTKAPNGKPCIYSVDGIRKNKSHSTMSVLEYGKPYGTDKIWYLQHHKITSNGQINDHGITHIHSDDAHEMLNRLGINAGKAPKNEMEPNNKKLSFDKMETIK